MMNMIESIFVIHDQFLMLIPDINTKSGVYSYTIILLGLLRPVGYTKPLLHYQDVSHVK